MSTERGYYCLVQYCPNLSRLETVNLGIVLFCPDTGFLSCQMTKRNDRPKKFFGSQIDGNALRREKKAFVARLERERLFIQDLSHLERFVRSRANHVLLTEPRPVKVFDPDTTLQELFQELVGEECKSKVPIFPQLHTFFEQLAADQKVELNRTIRIPVLDQWLQVPYAFRNGSLKLIKPQSFSDPCKDLNNVIKLAIQADLIQRYSQEPEGTEVIVVASFSSGETSHSQKQSILDVLREYKVQTVLLEELDDFMTTIQRDLSSQSA